MKKPVLVWFDMTIATRHAEVDSKFRDHFDIRCCSNPHRSDAGLELQPGVAICFQFDYPDRRGMSLLCRTKERYPHVPILMLTAQHSERLAVWAYRNRVLDYLVTPVPEQDLLRCKELLDAIQTAENRQNKRTIIDYKSNIPVEIPASQRTGTLKLAPALNFVHKNFRGKIRNAEIAALCGMSSFHFCHAFTEAFSQTFQEYVLRYRIFEACKELQHPNVPVANVAYSVGFNDPSYFARVFRRFVGRSPSEYCNQMSHGGFDGRMIDLIEKLGLPEPESMKAKGQRTYIDPLPIRSASRR